MEAGSQHAAERRQGEHSAHGGKAFFPGERADEELELPPEITVAAAFDAGSEFAHAARAVVRGVAFTGKAGLVGLVLRVQKGDAFEFPVLRDEEKDEPIDDAEKLAVKVGELHVALAEGVAQGGVLGMADEALAENLQRLLHAAAQVRERGDTLLGGVLAPRFEPAGIGTAIGAAGIAWRER